MNKCFITGRLTKDPVLEHTKNGVPTCQFNVATNRPVIRDGKREADFITCIAWNKQAENLTKYQRKGNLIGVQGSLRIDNYEINGEKRYKTYILVENVEFFDSKKKEEIENLSTKTITQETIEIEDEDLPW